jgi:hypothetical protein
MKTYISRVKKYPDIFGLLLSVSKNAHRRKFAQSGHPGEEAIKVHLRRVFEKKESIKIESKISATALYLQCDIREHTGKKLLSLKVFFLR